MGDKMDNLSKEKINEHAQIVADTIKICFYQVCPTPRELNQQELYNVIKTIGQTCFIRGYSIGLKENKGEENAVHE